MKKIITFMLAAAMIFSLAGCGSAKNENTESTEFASSEALLTSITETFKEDEQFPIGGGDFDNQVMDKPGKFDVSKVDEMEAMLGLPVEQAEKIDGAASMVHMMNANTFTGAAYHLADGTKATEFAEAVKESIMKKQWLCGMPDQLVIIDGGNGYVITAFGAEDIVGMFKDHTLEVLNGAEILVEEQIVDNF